MEHVQHLHIQVAFFEQGPITIQVNVGGQIPVSLYREVQLDFTQMKYFICCFRGVLVKIEKDLSNSI